MSRLDRKHDVIALAGELGLQGNPVEAILRFCQKKIEGWMAEVDAVRSVAVLESLVSEKLHLVCEEFGSDEELVRAMQKYTSQGKGGFAAVAMYFDDSTFGTTLERRKINGDARDRYVAFIDCRGEKGSRRFFTRWHEIAHLLTLTRQVELPVQRSALHPLERLMDEIAGHIGFYEPLFDPVFIRHCSNGRLTFPTVESVRQEFSSAASFQATLFACQRRLSTPAIYLQARMGHKVDTDRKIKAGQKSLFEDCQPVPKLRVSMVVPNEVAIREEFQIALNMRVPESSVIHRVLSSGDTAGDSATENLGSCESKKSGSLPEREVQVEARRIADQVVALVQPLAVAGPKSRR